jgi:hypothetical protein
MSIILNESYDFCTEPVNVGCAGSNGLSANASALLSLTRADIRAPAHYPTLAG